MCNYNDDDIDLDINPLHPKINIHVLHTVLYTFP